jgi:fumarate hydratase class II
MRLFATRCIDGIEVDSDRCRFHLENSVALITALSPLIGYDRAAEIAKQALKDRSPVKKALLDSGLFTLTELDTLLRPEALTRPGMIKKPSTPKAKEALP